MAELNRPADRIAGADELRVGLADEFDQEPRETVADEEQPMIAPGRFSQPRRKASQDRTRARSSPSSIAW